MRFENASATSSRAARVRGVRSVAVLRANRLGDFIVCLPALEALRAAYPGAEIVLLGKAWHRDFLAGRPSPIDRVVAIPAIAGLQDTEEEVDEPETVERFLYDMREERFDLALQMHGGGRHSNPLVRSLGARITAGLRAPDAEPLDRWIRYEVDQPEVIRYLEVAGLVGAPPTTLEPAIAVTAADRSEAGAVVPPGRGPLAALHPGAGYPERRWPPGRFAAVGDALARRGARVVITGTDDERPLAVAVRDAMAAEALDLTGALSLSGLTGLYARCGVVISNDTGPLHLARAAGAPTVGIYTGFNLIGYGPLTRELHRVAVSWRTERARCGPDCPGDFCERCEPFVADIEAGEVMEKALDLLCGNAGTGWEG